MPRDKTASHSKVLDAARAEFMEHGFENASMRRIGDRCGMTAAGLYRHCKDKADLFRQVVAPSIEKIDKWQAAHIQRSMANADSDNVDLWQDSEIDMMRDLIYPNMDEYRLLLTKAQGTVYEHYLHDLTERQQEMMLRFMPVIANKGFAVREIDSKQLHILLSAYNTAMFEPVIHGYSQEEALRCLDTLEAFFLPGWKMVMGV